MATVKLTTSIREEIITKLLRHRFMEDYNDLIAQGAKLADKIYNDVFTKKERDLMCSLPDGWLRTRESVSIQTNEGYTQINFNGYHYVEGFPKPHLVEFRPFPNSRIGGAAKVYEATDKLAEEISNLSSAWQTLEAHVKVTKNKVKSALNSVTTLGKLKTEWPEIAPFCPELEGDVNLPAIPTATLNEILKLPVEEAA